LRLEVAGYTSGNCIHWLKFMGIFNVLLKKLEVKLASTPGSKITGSVISVRLVPLSWVGHRGNMLSRSYSSEA
jgi:hypothetical protein